MRNLWRKLKTLGFSEWVHVSQTVILFITVAVTAWSIMKVDQIAKSSAESSDILQANVTWERYMEFAADHPKMAAGAVNFTDDFRNPDDAAYGWFVERVLMAAEQTLSFAPNDPQWLDSFRFEVNRHRRYIVSKMFLQGAFYSMPSYCTYTRGVRAMIRSSFDGSSGDGAAAMNALQAAEANCQAIYKKRNWPDA